MKSNSIFQIFFCAFLLISCNNGRQSDNNASSTDVETNTNNSENAAFTYTGKRIGPVKIGNTLDELKKTVGINNVSVDSFYVGEGEYVPGGKVFNGESVEIEFELTNDKISTLRIQNNNAPYKNDYGIKIGTTLKKLTKINGTDIVFYGFEWDYGGTVVSYAGGALKAMPKQVSLRLQYNCRPESMDKFLGMDKYSSNTLPTAFLDSIFVTMITIRM